MTWEAFIVAILSGLAGGSGISAIVRAFGQNRNEADQMRQAASDTFRAAILERVKDLEHAVETLNSQNDSLIGTNAQLLGKVAVYDAKFEIQTAQIQDLKQKLTTVTLENDMLKRENLGLRKRIETLEHGEVHP